VIDRMNHGHRAVVPLATDGDGLGHPSADPEKDGAPVIHLAADGCRWHPAVAQMSRCDKLTKEIKIVAQSGVFAVDKNEIIHFCPWRRFTMRSRLHNPHIPGGFATRKLSEGLRVELQMIFFTIVKFVAG
jgi:hypothetical protein